MKQTAMNLNKGRHGGRRENSGRKRIHSVGVSHKGRQKVTAHTPLHINFKYKAFIRTPGMLKNLEQAIQNASEFGFTVTHFTIQHNHIHLIAETKNNKSLEKGMRSLTNTIVKLFQQGSLQIERYHLHVLKTPNEVRNALKYVEENDVKHTGKKNRRYSRLSGLPSSWLLKTSATKA